LRKTAELPKATGRVLGSAPPNRLAERALAALDPTLKRRNPSGTFPATFRSHVQEGSAMFVAVGRWETAMSIGTIILIILVIALLGGFSGIGGGSFYGTGAYGGGGLGLIIVILLILVLLGKI
jgi:hypothetical protein